MSAASNYLELELLDHVFRNAAYTSPTNVYVKLHIGDPGEDCTSNPAGETTREAATFNAASGGQVTLAATVGWTNVSTTETYSYFSVWDASTGGNPLCYGPLASPVPVTATDNFDLTALVISLS